MHCEPQLQPLRCMEEQKLQLAGKDNGSMMLEAVGEACVGKMQLKYPFLKYNHEYRVV